MNQLSKLLHVTNGPIPNNSILSIRIDITDAIRWCPVCHGRKFAFIPSLNKYKEIECPYCAGQGAIKICKCNRPMPLWQEKCYNCILRLEELEKELDNEED